MSNLKRICQEVISAGESAVGTPYTTLDNGVLLTPTRQSFGHISASEFTTNYILVSANYADKLARAALVMEAALKFYRDANYKGCSEPAIVLTKGDCARQALASVEEILK